jgi:hypothetical protein
MASYNPGDVANGYCGNCHDWTGQPQVVPEIPENDGPRVHHVHDTDSVSARDASSGEA